MPLERLDKLVAVAMGISRVDAKKAIAQGRVTVDGARIRQGSEKADPEQAVLRVDGRERVYRAQLYLLMNKPLGYVSSTDDADPTVLELVPPELFRVGLFPAGRLDKYSEGMLILTDDGVFAHRMLAPKSHVPKTYYVEVDHPIIGSALAEQFTHGVALGGGEFSSPAQLEILTPTCARVTIHEGIYHQVRRMFDQNGAKVTRLVRISIGALPLDRSLAVGGCRMLSAQECAQLLVREGSNPKDLLFPDRL